MFGTIDVSLFKNRPYFTNHKRGKNLKASDLGFSDLGFDSPLASGYNKQTDLRHLTTRHNNNNRTEELEPMLELIVDLKPSVTENNTIDRELEITDSKSNIEEKKSNW